MLARGSFWLPLGALSLALGCAAEKPRTLPVATPMPAAASPVEDDDPAIAAARELFPGVFGLPPGKRALSAPDGFSIYVPITEHFHHLPPPECLNLLGQPGLRADFLGVAANSFLDGSGFTVFTPAVFRDRRAGYVFGIPSGARCYASMREAEADDPDAESEPLRFDLEQGLLFDQFVIIDPNGHDTRGEARVEFTEDGLIGVCPLGSKHPTAECISDSENESDDDAPPVEATAAAALPYLYDVARCAPGCEQLCPRGPAPLEDCSRPPPSVCNGKTLRSFFSGNDIGGRCQFETWTFHCSEGCAAGRCDAKTPALVWSHPLPGEEANLVLTKAGGVAVLSARELVIYDRTGHELSRTKLDREIDLPLLATADGGVIVASYAGDIQKLGRSQPWRTKLEVKPIIPRVAFHGETWCGTFGSSLVVVDTTTGKLVQTLELPGAAQSGPVFSARGTFSISVGRELLTYDARARLLGRVALAATIVSVGARGSSDEFIAVTEDGNVSIVNAQSARVIANVGKGALSTPVPTPDGGLLVVTRESPITGAATLHKLARGERKPVWSAKLSMYREPPQVDACGNIFVMNDAVLTAFTSDGAVRWSLDLRGDGNRSSARLAPNGVLYFSSYGRLSALSAAGCAR